MIRKKCYKLFKKQYPETWQVILAKFKESIHYMETGRTMGQRHQLFNKSVKRLTQSVSFWTSAR